MNVSSTSQADGSAGVARLAPEAFAERAQAIEREVGRVIVGQTALVRQTLTGLLANSHVLLEGVPGLGKPGDPSYVSGTGGDGQTQQGNQQGQGTNNGTLTPYQQVFTDFERYAQTSLDRGYIPLSIKDYVRDYFSSLDPTK